MKLRNKLYNWRYGVKRYRGKGCINCGITRKSVIVKYNWLKPFTFTTKPISFGEPRDYMEWIK